MWKYSDHYFVAFIPWFQPQLCCVFIKFREPIQKKNVETKNFLIPVPFS